MWPRNLIFTLIERYKNAPELWDTKCPDYKNLTIKNGAISNMAQEFNLTDLDVKKKIHNLRTQYNNLARKVNENEPIKWRFFDSLRFLGGLNNPDAPTPRIATKPNKITNNKNSPANEDNPHKHKIKKRRISSSSEPSDGNTNHAKETEITSNGICKENLQSTDDKNLQKQENEIKRDIKIGMETDNVTPTLQAQLLEASSKIRAHLVKARRVETPRINPEIFKALSVQSLKNKALRDEARNVKRRKSEPFRTKEARARTPKVEASRVEKHKVKSFRVDSTKFKALSVTTPIFKGDDSILIKSESEDESQSDEVLSVKDESPIPIVLSPSRSRSRSPQSKHPRKIEETPLTSNEDKTKTKRINDTTTTTTTPADKDYVLLTRATSASDPSKDEYQVFGDYIASELRLLKSQKSRKLLRRKIQKAILDVSELDDFNGSSST